MFDEDIRGRSHTDDLDSALLVSDANRHVFSEENQSAKHSRWFRSCVGRGRSWRWRRWWRWGGCGWRRRRRSRPGRGEWHREQTSTSKAVHRGLCKCRVAIERAREGAVGIIIRRRREECGCDRQQFGRKDPSADRNGNATHDQGTRPSLASLDSRALCVHDPPRCRESRLAIAHASAESRIPTLFLSSSQVSLTLLIESIAECSSKSLRI